MAIALLAFTSCADKTNKTEGDVTAADTTQVKAVEAKPEAVVTVVGTWKLSDMDMGMEVPKGKEKQFEEMMAKMKAETTFTFNKDGTMSGDNPAVKGTTGTYTYEYSKLIITDSKTKKTETLNVDELTADKLVISNEQNGKKAVMTFSK